MTTNGNGNGNGHTPPPAPVSVLKPKARAVPAGTNGHANAAAPAPAPEPPPVSRALRLAVGRSGNDDGDIQLMQRVYDLLRDYENGDDLVYIHLSARNEGTVVLRMRGKYRCDRGLLEGLGSVLGQSAVVVEG